VPLHRSILEGELGYDEPTAALLRFRFENAGDTPVDVCLPVRYSGDSRRSFHFLHIDPGQSEHLVPKSPMESLAVSAGSITSRHQGREVLRCFCETVMSLFAEGGAALLRQTLQPGGHCEALLKIPYLAPDSAADLEALARLDFDLCRQEVTQFWRWEKRERRAAPLAGAPA